MVTYTIKAEGNGRSHVFYSGVCECDESRHDDYKIIARGLKIKSVTCGSCLRMIPSIVMRELAMALEKSSQ